MVFLSRLSLDPRDRAVRRDLGDLQALHRTMMAGFGDGPVGQARADFGVLWRLEPDSRRGQLSVLVQSAVAPDWGRLPTGYLLAPAEVKPIDAALGALAPGARLRFRLLANPSRKIDTRSSPDGARRNSRRVPLRTEEEILTWLIRKASAAGFDVGPDAASAARRVAVRTMPDAHGWRTSSTGSRRSTRLTVRGAVFDGELIVADPGRLRSALVAGIGPGKAYGFGLLSLAPAR